MTTQASQLAEALKEVSAVKAKADDHDNADRSLAAVKYRLELKQIELAKANQRLSEMNEEYEKKAEHCRFLGEKIRDLSGAVPNNKYIHKLEADIRKASQQEARLLKQIEQQSNVVPPKQSSKNDEIEFMKKELSNLKREHQRETKLLKMKHQDELRSGSLPGSSKGVATASRQGLHSVTAMTIRHNASKVTTTRLPMQTLN
jgi:chromosome segregation ATPase